MRRTRKTYSKEFKEGAIRLVEEYNLACSQAESNLGIGKGVVSRWIEIFNIN
jgi:transposase-like protein